MKEQEFHIAGGGIAGLASAMAVANSGNSAIVMEKSARFDVIGAGLQLGPNAVAALKKLGAWDEVEAHTFAPPEIIIRNGKNGKTLRRIALGEKFENQFGQPYRVAHRADLHQALLSVAKANPNIQIKTNVEVSDVYQFKNLIAADGVWSKTREILFPGTCAVVSADVIHRALIAAAEVPDPNVNLWLFSGGHVVHYPVGNPIKLNLVAVTPGAAPQLHFQNACSELQSILALSNSWSTWPAAYVSPLPQWHKNNVTLIGDAAHGTLPNLAQGAAMALEDAAGLLSCLQNNDSATRAFAALTEQRRLRTTKLHKASLRMGQIYHADAPLAAARNLAMAIIPNFIMEQQTNWIYRLNEF